MKLDAKQKLLVAMYIEYQKDLPDMWTNVTPEKVGIDADVFAVAVEKLQNEELIQGANIGYVMGSGITPNVEIGFVKMTRHGLEYVESKFEIKIAENSMEKVKIISKKVAEFGYEQLHSFAAKVFAELQK